NGIAVGAGGEIHGIAHRLDPTRDGTVFTGLGECHVEHFLPIVFAIQPHLDYLESIKVGTFRILHAPDDKAWRFYIARRRTKLCPHGNTLAVRLIKPIYTGHYICRIIPASKETYAHTSS